MKKLMFAIAAVAAGATFADITSANVVGYQKITMKGNGYTWVGATIKAMDNTLEEQRVGDFKVPTDLGFIGYDSVFFETYNDDGTADKKYYFVDEGFLDGYFTETLEKPGWYDAEYYDGGMYEFRNEDYAADDILPFGKGAIITSFEVDTDITFSGEVLGESKTFTLVGNGYTWASNCSPVPVALKDLAVPTDSGFIGYDSVFLETYNTDGTPKKKYYFVDEGFLDGYFTETLEAPGWYDAEYYDSGMYEFRNEDYAGTDTLAPGELAIITSFEADTTYTIPTAIPAPAAE